MTSCVAEIVFAASLPTLAAAAGPTPAPTLEQIVETRAIDSLSVSPDGRRIAARVLAPSLETGRTSERWYVSDLTTKAKARPIGPEAEPVWMPIFDMPRPGTSAWVGGSSKLAVLRNLGGRTAVVVLSEAADPELLTQTDRDVTAFEIGGSGSTLSYTTAPSAADQIAAQTREEIEGVRIDRSVDTEGLRLTRNHRAGPHSVTVRRTSAVEARPIPLMDDRREAVDLPSALHARPVEPSGSIILESDPEPTRPFGPPADRFALVEQPSDADGKIYRRFRLTAITKRGRRTCTHALCEGLTRDLRQVGWVARTGEALLIRETDQGARSSVLAWSPARNRIRTIFETAGSLGGGSESGPSGCAHTPTVIACVQSAPNAPPRLVAVELASGRLSVLLDPNETLRGARFPVSRFVSWNDARGRRSTGVLTLPRGTHRNLPLVLTSYSCRGFLRGGTGRLTPEHVLATRGISSLCVNLDVAAPVDRDPAGRQRPLARIRAVTESYRAGVDMLVRIGVADPARVAISGHSFSGNVAAYAISHTKLFAAASIGSGVTIDPLSYYVTSPTADSFRKDTVDVMGLPIPDRDPAGIWASNSPALNAAAITAPLLLQPPENEWLMSLQLFGAIQDAGGTVDAYVYPEAGHLFGRDPRKLLSRARRSVEWLARWLDRPAAAAAEVAELRDGRAGGAAQKTARGCPASDHLDCRALSQASTSTSEARRE